MMRSEEFRALLTSLVEAATAGKINETAKLASAVESAFRDATATRLDIPAAFHTCRDDWRDAIATAVAGSQASPEALRSFDRAYSQLSSALCQQIPPVRPRAEVEERARSVLLAASENPGEISSGSLSTREARVSAVVNQIAKAVEQSAAGEVVHVDRLLSRAAELAWFCSSMPHDCVANAQRWEAVISTGRVRVIGSAGVRDKLDPDGKPYNNYAHIGLELWTKHRSDATFPSAISDFEGYANVAVAARHDFLNNPDRRHEFDYYVKSPCGRAYGFNREDVHEDYRMFLVQQDRITGVEADKRINENPGCIDSWLVEQFLWPEILKYGAPLSDPDRGVLLAHMNDIRDNSVPLIESGKGT